MDFRLMLNQILMNIGGSRLDDESWWGNFSDPRVVEFLLEYGREFPMERLERLRETPFPGHRQPLHPVQCHKNCVDLRCYVGTGSSEYRIVYGWALGDNGIWYCHSWCVKRTGPENIIETTRPRIGYFGFVVPDEIHALATLFVPSSLGDQLENWKFCRPKQPVPGEESHPSVF
jgi:hypothetical protein